MPRPDGMDLLYGFESQGQQALTNLLGLKSPFEGIETSADVAGRFGTADVSKAFDPLYKRLATQKAQSLRGAAMRSGRSASPGMTFSPIEAGYSEALSGLGASEAQADIGEQNRLADMLFNILGSRGEFGLRKSALSGQMASNLFQNRLGLEQFNTQNQGPNFFDYFATLVGGASKPVAALLGRA